MNQPAPGSSLPIPLGGGGTPTIMSGQDQVSALRQGQLPGQPAPASGPGGGGGGGYTLSPEVIQDVIGDYKKLQQDLQDDYFNIQFIAEATAPSPDFEASVPQAHSVASYGSSMLVANRAMETYVASQIQKHQRALDEYHKQEQDAAQAMNKQL